MREFVKNYDNFINENYYNEELDTEIYNDETEEFDEELYEAYLEDEEVINELFGINKAIKSNLLKQYKKDSKDAKRTTRYMSNGIKDEGKTKIMIDARLKNLKRNYQNVGKGTSIAAHAGIGLGIGAIGVGLYAGIKGIINAFKSLDKKEMELKEKLIREEDPDKKEKIEKEIEIIKMKKEHLKEKAKEKKKEHLKEKAKEKKE